MFPASRLVTQTLCKRTPRRVLTWRWSSSSAVYDSDDRRQAQELVTFPGEEGKPVLLNAQEHVVGYLSKILNAQVYDAAIETDLQHAKNLSAVSMVVPCKLFSIYTHTHSLIYHP